MSDPFIGQITIFGGNFAPRSWAFCDGQLLSIAQNTALFSILGTTYGGDGRTTFGLPNLQGRLPMHPGNGPGLSQRRLGQIGGTEKVTLTALQLGGHTHTSRVSPSPGEGPDPAGNALGRSVGAAVYALPAAAGLVPMAADAVGNTGGGQAHDESQPFQVLNFIIAVVGFFPSRN